MQSAKLMVCDAIYKCSIVCVGGGRRLDAPQILFGTPLKLEKIVFSLQRMKKYKYFVYKIVDKHNILC